MKENEINIDDYVYVVRKFGTLKRGFDLQIVKYKVQYKGLTKFIPYGFQDMLDKCKEIPYDLCSKTLEEAKKIVYLNLDNSYSINSVEFVEQHSIQYYDVKFK